MAYKRNIAIGLPETDIIKRIAQRTAAVHDQITFIFVFLTDSHREKDFALDKLTDGLKKGEM